MKKVSKNFEKIIAKAAMESASNKFNSTCRLYVKHEIVPQTEKKKKKKEVKETRIIFRLPGQPHIFQSSR